jgi:ATP-binding cassette subfamily C (CFTR/MRP) protein 1
VWTFSSELSLALVPRLAFVGFSLAQPYLIKTTIAYITNHSRLPGNYGYGLVGAYALCYMGLAVSMPDA